MYTWIPIGSQNNRQRLPIYTKWWPIDKIKNKELPVDTYLPTIVTTMHTYLPTIVGI